MEWHVTDAQSLAIIDSEIENHVFSPAEYEIVRRVIYSTADFLQGTAEGVNTCRVLMQRAKQQNIPVPITEQVYRLLQGEVTPRQALDELMLRDIKPEYNY